jgi:hypothetical protein
MREAEIAVAVRAAGIDGATASRVAGVVTITAVDCAEALPAASNAWTVYE